MGWSALTFDSAILEPAKELKALKLIMKRAQCGFIPPVEELDRSFGLADDDEDGDDGSQEAEHDLPLTILRHQPRWTGIYFP